VDAALFWGYYVEVVFANKLNYFVYKNIRSFLSNVYRWGFWPHQCWLVDPHRYLPVFQIYWYTLGSQFADLDCSD